MGVYIKGMEMPKHWRDCMFSNGAVQCCLLNMESCGNGIPCPLIPVPDHGRLGDLDKLVEKIDGIWDCNDMVFSPNDHCCNVPEDCKGCRWVETRNFIRRMVANAQTIIPKSEESE